MYTYRQQEQVTVSSVNNDITIGMQALICTNDWISISLKNADDFVNLILISYNVFIGTQSWATSWQTVSDSMRDPLPHESETGISALSSRVLTKHHQHRVKSVTNICIKQNMHSFCAYIQSLTTASGSRLFGSVVRAFEFLPRGPEFESRRGRIIFSYALFLFLTAFMS